MLGAKISDLMLGEKNVVDFVDKNLLQERDRLHENCLETEYLCQHMTGGVLDYPFMISHDFCDITTAWDVYLDSFTRTTISQLPKKPGTGIYPKSEEKNERLGKMPFRGDELTIKQFLNAIVLCSPKIRTHLIECTEEVLADGRLWNIYVIISNIVIIRNYIWTFLEIFEYDAKDKLKLEYKQFSELVEVISEQLLQIQANLLTTYVLHCPQSQNFGGHQPYFEGERGSPTIQMWCYFLRSFQRDMWSIMPPQLSQRIFSIILNDSLAILASRYGKLKPSQQNIPQYCSDIVNILAGVEEFLFFICPDISSVCGQADPASSKVVFSIHLKCHCLASSLLVVGSPLEVLYKSFRRGLSTCCLFESRRKDPRKLTDSAWMSVLSYLCPQYYPTGLDYLDWELLFSLKLLRGQPNVNWGLVFKVVTLNNVKIGRFITGLFAGVVAPAGEFLLEGKAFQRCKLASCMEPECHGLEKSLANYKVVSCVLYVVAYGLGRRELVGVYREVLRGIKDWSVMDKEQIWNLERRPVWFQGLVDIVLPILKSCVQSLSLSIKEGGDDLPQGEEKVTGWVVELLNTVTETLSVIPRGFFMVCEELDDLVGRRWLPTRGSVSVHLIVAGLYMLLGVGEGVARSIGVEGVGQGVWEGIRERLCGLEDKVFDQAVHRLISQIESMMKQSKGEKEEEEIRGKGGMEEEYVLEWERANLKADFLLEEAEGQLSLRVIYWWLVTHGEVVEQAITGEGKKGKGEGLKIEPRIRTKLKEVNIIHDFHYVNRYRTFDQVKLGYLIIIILEEF